MRKAWPWKWAESVLMVVKIKKERLREEERSPCSPADPPLSALAQQSSWLFEDWVSVDRAWLLLMEKKGWTRMNPAECKEVGLHSWTSQYGEPGWAPQRKMLGWDVFDAQRSPFAPTWKLWVASQDSALAASAVNAGEWHHRPWLCLEQHKTWLRVKTIVNAGWVRFMPGGAQRRGGDRALLMNLLFKWRTLKKQTEKDGVAGDTDWHCSGITVRRCAWRAGRAERVPGRSCRGGGVVPRGPCFGACTPPWTRSHCWAVAVLLPGCTWCCKHPRIWWEALGSWIGNLQAKERQSCNQGLSPLECGVLWGEGSFAFPGT